MPRQVTSVFGPDQLNHVLQSRAVVALEVGDGDDVVLARLLRVQKRNRKMYRRARLKKGQSERNVKETVLMRQRAGNECRVRTAPHL